MDVKQINKLDPKATAEASAIFLETLLKRGTEQYMALQLTIAFQNAVIATGQQESYAIAGFTQDSNS